MPTILSAPDASSSASASARVDISPAMRSVVAVSGTVMTAATLYALARGLTGFAPPHANARHLAVIIHVAAVLPAIPLGAWLLLSRKGTGLHRQLGKLWIALMLTAASAAIFIQTSGGFSWLHLFVPLTFLGSWQAYASARAGRLTEHRRYMIPLYFGALLTPGAFAFLGGRLMGDWLYG